MKHRSLRQLRAHPKWPGRLAIDGDQGYAGCLPPAVDHHAAQYKASRLQRIGCGRWVGGIRGDGSLAAAQALGQGLGVHSQGRAAGRSNCRGGGRCGPLHELQRPIGGAACGQKPNKKCCQMIPKWTSHPAIITLV